MAHDSITHSRASLEDAEVEAWKPIPEHEGYEVSTLGNVRSVNRVIHTTRRGRPWIMRHGGKTLTPVRDRGGYLVVGLRLKWRKIHHLVLEAFVGARPAGYHCAHGDGVRDNNRLENLRWATPQENEADKDLHGTRAVGERIGASKLTAAQVAHIRMTAADRSHTQIAAEYGVHQTTISRILRGAGWQVVS